MEAFSLKSEKTRMSTITASIQQCLGGPKQWNIWKKNEIQELEKKGQYMLHNFKIIFKLLKHINY